MDPPREGTDRRTALVTCRECESEVNQATEICPHCGADLTLAASDDSATKKKPPTLGQIVLRWGILLSVLLGAMWSFLWFVLPARTGHVALQAEAHAVEAMSDIRTVLNDYAAAQGGTYPPTLEPLGLPARQAAQLAQSEGYRLQYNPGPAAADGGIRTYEIQARAGNAGYRSFYADNSGVVRATTEDRDANSLDSPLR